MHRHHRKLIRTCFTLVLSLFLTALVGCGGSSDWNQESQADQSEKGLPLPDRLAALATTVGLTATGDIYQSSDGVTKGSLVQEIQLTRSSDGTQFIGTFDQVTTPGNYVFDVTFTYRHSSGQELTVATTEMAFSHSGGATSLSPPRTGYVTSGSATYDPDGDGIWTINELENGTDPLVSDAVSGTGGSGGTGGSPTPLTLYVSKSGNDSNDGSQSKPFLTIGKAITVAEAVTPKRDVFVAKGVYNETVIIRGSNLYGGYDNTNGWSRNVTQNVTEITLTTTIDSASIFITSGVIDGFKITNVALNNVSFGILVGGGGNSVIRQNNIDLSGGSSLRTQTHAIYASSGGGVLTISNNTINGGNASLCYGITVENLGPVSTITNNKITGGVTPCSSIRAISIQNTSAPSTISNNVMLGSLSVSSSSVIVTNTILAQGQSIIYGNSTPLIANNAIIVSGSGTVYGLSGNVGATGAVPSRIENNFIMLDPSSSGTLVMAGNGANNASTIAALNALNGTNGMVVSGNITSALPLASIFNDSTTDDYTLKTGSPLIDAGRDVSTSTYGSVTTDFAGTARPRGAAFDIGAFEF